MIHEEALYQVYVPLITFTFHRLLLRRCQFLMGNVKFDPLKIDNRPLEKIPKCCKFKIADGHHIENGFLSDLLSD